MIADATGTLGNAAAGVDGAPVIVATLGDDESFAAVGWADTVAHRLGSTVVVVDAEPTTDHSATTCDDSARCDEVAAELERRLDAAGLCPDEVRCEAGSPSTVVLDAASTARLVVIESHRAKAGHRFGHGHLAAELARHLDCPLLVVPRGRVERPDEIVVGLDGTRGNESVLAWAHEAASAFECVVTAVHVTDPLTSVFCTRHGGPAERAARRTATAGGSDLVTRAGEQPAVELLDVAIARSAGLVVVGTKQVPGVFEPILGEVTARLLEQDDVAVAVVPDGDVDD